MTTGYALTIERKYGAGIVRVMAKHNLREIAAEIGTDSHIDPARIADNIILRGPGTANSVALLAKSLMKAANVPKLKKTAVWALELLFTLPADTTIDPSEYFEKATSWTESYFKVPVLSSVIHLDEGAPHAHILLLPLVDGRMNGSDLYGGLAKLWAMQKSFHDEVGEQYGIVLSPQKKRLPAAVRTAAMLLVRCSLQANGALTDAVIDALLKPHAKNPEALLLAMGLSMPAPKAKGKSFADIMTAPCKPELSNPIRKAIRNPIGLEIPAVTETSQPYTCVGIGFSTALISPQSDNEPATQPAPTTTARMSSTEVTTRSKSATMESADIKQEPGVCEQPNSTRAALTNKRQPASCTTDEALTDGSPLHIDTMSLSHCDEAPDCDDGRSPCDDQRPLPLTVITASDDTVSKRQSRSVQAEQDRNDHLQRYRDKEPSDNTGDDYQREREDEQPTGQWSEELGDFIAPTIKASVKFAVIASVRAALKVVGGHQQPGGDAC